MSAFPKLTVTATGLSMIAAAHGLDTIHFTTAHFGDGVSGDPPGAWLGYTGLIHDRHSVGISETRHANMADFVTLTFEVSSTAIAVGFLARELGIYAEGNDGVEKLYAYANAGDRSDWFADASSPEDTTFEPSVYIGNGTSFTAVVDPAGLVNITRLTRELKTLKDDVEGQIRVVDEKVDAIDVPGTEVKLPGSEQVAITPTAKAYGGGGTVLAQAPGAAAGDYTIKEALDALFKVSHTHSAASVQGKDLPVTDVLGTKINVEGSSQTAISPTAKAYGGSGTLLSQQKGLAAGTYTLGNLLKQITMQSHTHGTKALGNAGSGNCAASTDCKDCKDCAASKDCAQCAQCSQCSQCYSDTSG